MPRPSAGRTYHRGDLRNTLLTFARGLIRERRSIEFSMRDLAEGVGVTQPAIYRHFRGREDILDAICLEGFALYDAAQGEALAAAPDDPWEKVLALGKAHFRFALDWPDYFRVMFEARITSRPEILPSVIPTFHKVVRYVEEGQAAGVIAPGHPREVAIAFWAMFHGLATLFLNGPVADRPERTERLLERVAETLRSGLRSG